MVVKKRVPVVNLDVKNKDSVKIVLLGDIHLGQENCAKNDLKKTIKWIKNHSNAYVIGMGDYLEMAVEGHIKGSTYEQSYIPNKQRQEFVEIMSTIKNRVLGLVSGNHEMVRSYKLTSIDVTEIMAEQLGVPYWRDGGFVIINLWRGKKKLQTYSLVVMHGTGKSTTPDYLIRKALKCYSDPDIIAMGHIHQLWNGNVYRYLVDSEKGLEDRKKIACVRTGGYLDGARYARESLFPPSAIGSPIIELKTNEKKVFVDTETLEYVAE